VTSPASRALATILLGDSASARRLRERPSKPKGQPIHRSKLWQYSTGRGKPKVETAAFIERATDGVVKANAWEDDD
jgi:hypothetical protein